MDRFWVLGQSMAMRVFHIHVQTICKITKYELYSYQSTQRARDNDASTAMTLSTKEIPKTMKLLAVKSLGKYLSTCQIEVETDALAPMLKPGKVLIEVIASEINLSDYGSWFRCPKNFHMQWVRKGQA